jgi:hypothetical protein
VCGFLQRKCATRSLTQKPNALQVWQKENVLPNTFASFFFISESLFWLLWSFSCNPFNLNQDYKASARGFLWAHKYMNKVPSVLRARSLARWPAKTKK